MVQIPSVPCVRMDAMSTAEIPFKMVHHLVGKGSLREDALGKRQIFGLPIEENGFIIFFSDEPLTTSYSKRYLNRSIERFI